MRAARTALSRQSVAPARIREAVVGARRSERAKQPDTVLLCRPMRRAGHTAAAVGELVAIITIKVDIGYQDNEIPRQIRLATY